MYRAAPYAWEAESGSVAQITCVIEMRRETLIKFPSRQRPIAARAGYARGHLCYTWLAAALRWYLGARGGQGWTTGGRHVAAMEVRRCRAIATRQALDTARVPKAPPETLPTVARATGATRSGVKKIGAHLPRAHAHPRNAVHHPATPPGIAGMTRHNGDPRGQAQATRVSPAHAPTPRAMGMRTPGRLPPPAMGMARR